MAGVRVTRGVQLRIPPGGLVLPLDGSPPPPLRYELRLDVWIHWMALAVRAEKEAFTARIALRRALSQENDGAVAQAMERELQAGMQLAGATAFALDAVYDSTKQRLPAGLLPEWAWRQNRTSRPARIVETIRVASTIDARTARRAKSNTATIFKWRDWAVHPEAQFKDPAWHPAAQASVEWHFVAFRCENARALLSGAFILLDAFWNHPRPKRAEVVEWSAFCLGELAQLRASRNLWECAPVARQ